MCYNELTKEKRKKKRKMKTNFETIRDILSMSSAHYDIIEYDDGTKAIVLSDGADEVYLDFNEEGKIS